MSQPEEIIAVYLENGKKRTFAAAIDWPGWCRSGKDDEFALQALFDYGARYKQAILPAGLKFQTPRDPSNLVVIARIMGTATTDFGAPDAVPDADSAPLNVADQQRLLAVLDANWQKLAQALNAGAGHELSKGPRGGGRGLESIGWHVLSSCDGYLSKLGWKHRTDTGAQIFSELNRSQQAVEAALNASLAGELPTRGPRGGEYWPPRYFVRRLAWHILDHAWEIEDRIL